MAKEIETQDSGNPLDGFGFDSAEVFAGFTDETEDIVDHPKPPVKKEKVAAEPGDKGEEEEDDPADDAFDDWVGGEGNKIEEELRKKLGAKKKVVEEDDEEEGEEEAPPAKKQKVKAEIPPQESDDTGEEEEEEEGEEDEDDDSKFFTTLAGELKERKVFDFELKDGETIDEDKFFELIENDVESRVNETFEAFSEDMDQDGKDFIEFKKNGGKTADFLRTYGSVLDLEEFDKENPTHVEMVLNHHLKTVEGLAGDELEDRKQWMHDKGKAKDYAGKFYNAHKESVETAKTALVEAQKKAIEKSQQEAKQFTIDLNEVLKKDKKIGPFDLNDKEVKALIDFATKPIIKVGKNRHAPEFGVKLSEVLQAKTPEAKKKFLLLAKIISEDFKLDGIEADVQTKVIKKAQSKLKEVKRGISASSKKYGSRKSAIDFF